MTQNSQSNSDIKVNLYNNVFDGLIMERIKMSLILTNIVLTATNSIYRMEKKKKMSF